MAQERVAREKERNMAARDSEQTESAVSTWIGAVSTDWLVAGNWSTGEVPRGQETAVIGLGNQGQDSRQGQAGDAACPVRDEKPTRGDQR